MFNGVEGRRCQEKNVNQFQNFFVSTTVQSSEFIDLFYVNYMTEV